MWSAARRMLGKWRDHAKNVCWAWHAMPLRNPCGFVAAQPSSPGVGERLRLGRGIAYGATRLLRTAKRINSLKLPKFILCMM